jgi:hypothetical protein
MAKPPKKPSDAAKRNAAAPKRIKPTRAKAA